MRESQQSDDRTQKEKMLAGDLYISDDLELEQASRRAYRLAKEYEAQYAIARSAAHKVLEELLGQVAPDVHIKPPLYVDYGRCENVCELWIGGSGRGTDYNWSRCPDRTERPAPYPNSPHRIGFTTRQV